MAAGLLCEVYRVLKPDTGVYVIVSFHDIAFLQQMLTDFPGADWQVTLSTMWREIEDLTTTTSTQQTGTSTRESDATGQIIKARVSPPQPSQTSSTAVWSSEPLNPTGTIDAPSIYSSVARNDLLVVVVVVIVEQPTTRLNWEAVYQHIHDTNNRWYSQQHPLLSD